MRGNVSFAQGTFYFFVISEATALFPIEEGRSVDRCFKIEKERKCAVAGSAWAEVNTFTQLLKLRNKFEVPALEYDHFMLNYILNRGPRCQGPPK